MFITYLMYTIVTIFKVKKVAAKIDCIERML